MSPVQTRPLGRTGAEELLPAPAKAGVRVAAARAPLTDTQLADLERVYDERIRAHVHDRW
ncbi:hypothetical protein [Geodermatophilus ruber]|uniref:Uncharacterized protein n=1 Tax=Geodermatophilus ruber TaxID=504800 RepID=A0A1I4FFR8_9ACTN|nr:hypothetical protein [Geodermatophilus ruber]SFL16772.1 hypothetical protein SAMN04488085_107146 [Geodermatophilus ruber]